MPSVLAAFTGFWPTVRRVGRKTGGVGGRNSNRVTTARVARIEQMWIARPWSSLLLVESNARFEHYKATPGGG